MLEPHLVQAIQSITVCAGKLLGVYIEVEGMKALNTERDRRGESLGYGEDAFAIAGTTTEEIIRELQQIVA